MRPLLLLPLLLPLLLVLSSLPLAFTDAAPDWLVQDGGAGFDLRAGVAVATTPEGVAAAVCSVGAFVLPTASSGESSGIVEVSSVITGGRAWAAYVTSPAEVGGGASLNGVAFVGPASARDGEGSDAFVVAGAVGIGPGGGQRVYVARFPATPPAGTSPTATWSTLLRVSGIPDAAAFAVAYDPVPERVYVAGGGTGGSFVVCLAASTDDVQWLTVLDAVSSVAASRVTGLAVAASGVVVASGLAVGGMPSRDLSGGGSLPAVAESTFLVRLNAASGHVDEQSGIPAPANTTSMLPRAMAQDADGTLYVAGSLVRPSTTLPLCAHLMTVPGGPCAVWWRPAADATESAEQTDGFVARVEPGGVSWFGVFGTATGTEEVFGVAATGGTGGTGAAAVFVCGRAAGGSLVDSDLAATRVGFVAALAGADGAHLWTREWEAAERADGTASEIAFAGVAVAPSAPDATGGAGVARLGATAFAAGYAATVNNSLVPGATGVSSGSYDSLLLRTGGASSAAGGSSSSVGPVSLRAVAQTADDPDLGVQRVNLVWSAPFLTRRTLFSAGFVLSGPLPPPATAPGPLSDSAARALRADPGVARISVMAEAAAGSGTTVVAVPWGGSVPSFWEARAFAAASMVPEGLPALLLPANVVPAQLYGVISELRLEEPTAAVSARSPRAELTLMYTASAPAGPYPPVLSFSVLAATADSALAVDAKLTLNHTEAGLHTRAVAVTFDTDHEFAIAGVHESLDVAVAVDGAEGVQTPYAELDGGTELLFTVVKQATITCGFRSAAGAAGADDDDEFLSRYARLPPGAGLARAGVEAGCALDLPLDPAGDPTLTLLSYLVSGSDSGPAVTATETVGPTQSDTMSPPFLIDDTLAGLGAAGLLHWKTSVVPPGPPVGGFPLAAPGNVTAAISVLSLGATPAMVSPAHDEGLAVAGASLNATFEVLLSRHPLVSNVTVSLEVEDDSGTKVGAGPYTTEPASVVVPPASVLLPGTDSVETEPASVVFTLVVNTSSPGLRSGAFYARAVLADDPGDGDGVGEGLTDGAGGAELFVAVPAVEVLQPLPVLHRGIPTGPLRARVRPLPHGTAADTIALTPRTGGGTGGRKLVFSPASAGVDSATGEAEFEMQAAVPADVDGEWAEDTSAVGVAVDLDWHIGDTVTVPSGAVDLPASVDFFAVAPANRSAGRALDNSAASTVPVLVAVPRVPDASLELALVFASELATAAAFNGAGAVPSAPLNLSAVSSAAASGKVASRSGGTVSDMVFVCGGVGAAGLGTGTGSDLAAPSPPVPAPQVPPAVAAGVAAGLTMLAGECETPPGVGGPFSLLLLYREVYARPPGEWLLGAAAAGVLSYAGPQPVPGTVRQGATAPVGRTSVDVPAVGNTDVYFDVDGAGSDPTALTVTLAPPGTPRGDAAETECVMLQVPAVLPAVPDVAGRYTAGCRVAAGQGSGLVFTVRAGGLEGTGSDTLSFVQVPEVLGVTGCPAGGCRTAGGDTVTLTGVHLGADYAPLVEVGGAACENPTVPAPVPGGGGNATVECTLGAGSGVGRPVSVSRVSGVLLLRSNPLPAVDFAVPAVDALVAAAGSCDGRGVGNATLTGCPREGGWRLTVEGRHFGVAAADVRVLVGAGPCGNATVERVSDALDRQRIECDAPPGAALDQAVLVIPANGDGAGAGGSGAALVSYSECPPGTFRNAELGACTECPPFEYQDVPGQPQCRSCEDGRYQPAYERELAVCVPCPDGARCLPSLPVLASEGYWLAPRAGVAGGEAALAAAAPPLSYRCHGTRCLDASECYAGSDEQRAAGSEQLSCCGPDRPPAEVNPLCGRCNEGLSEWSGSCVECGGVNYGLLLGYLALGVVLLAGLRASSANTSGAGVKVFVAFGQTVFAFYHDRPRVVAGGAALSLNPVMLSPTCVTPMDDLTKAVMPVVQLALMFALLGVLVLLGAAHWALFARGRGLRFKRSGYIRVAVALVSFSSLPLLRTAVTLLLCVDVGGTRYLRDYPTVVCGSGGHTAWLAVTWTLAAALVLGGSSFVLLYGQRQYRAYLRAASAPGGGKSSAGVDAGVKRLRKEIETRYGFLFLAFRGSLPGRPRQEALTASWEAVILARAFLFVLCSTLLQEWRARFMGLSLVAFLAQALHLSARPYRTSAENMAETLSLGTMVVIGTINSGAGPDDDTAGTLSSFLFYGFLAGLFVWGVGGAARRGGGAIARSVRKIRSSSSASLASSAGAEAREGPGKPWTARVARFFCWYMPEAGAGGASRAWPAPAAGRAASAAAHSASAAAEGVELCEMSISENGETDDAKGAPDVVVDAMGRRWVSVPAWSCHETGESQWDAPQPAS